MEFLAFPWHSTYEIMSNINIMVSPEQLHSLRLSRPNLMLIHVGSQTHFQNCRLPNSINFPMVEFDRINAVLAGENDPQRVEKRSYEEKVLRERSDRLLLARARVITATDDSNNARIAENSARIAFEQVRPLRNIEPMEFAEKSKKLEEATKLKINKETDLERAFRMYDVEVSRQNEPIVMPTKEPDTPSEPPEKVEKVTYMDVEKRGEGLFSGTGRTFPGFDQAIVLYGNNKQSLVAKMAKVHMNEYGFTNIFVLEDGLEGWRDKGLPVEGDCDVMLIREYIR